MLKWNLTWVLRFAPVRFICGLLLFVLSIYMLWSSGRRHE